VLDFDRIQGLRRDRGAVFNRHSGRRVVVGIRESSGTELKADDGWRRV
jgi:hypothetical protein